MATEQTTMQPPADSPQASSAIDGSATKSPPNGDESPHDLDGLDFGFTKPSGDAWSQNDPPAKPAGKNGDAKPATGRRGRPPGSTNKRIRIKNQLTQQVRVIALFRMMRNEDVGAVYLDQAPKVVDSIMKLADEKPALMAYLEKGLEVGIYGELALAFGPIMIAELVTARIVPPVAAQMVGQEKIADQARTSHATPSRLEKLLSKSSGNGAVTPAYPVEPEEPWDGVDRGTI